ncbi:uncharacterized protein M421DRAFT_4300 [Didymella exigua CBS 183.55]|uniref:Uncharacterized protein n=1 Tax=Didymella exigua CBS 183.55 TaxID=1150837 RepID=A0A6A5RRA1_9PLEO|nr:uncharacterized protein M421DRAFT_4300 [Didymella exigua CBS 183.55]KAF1929870.1 hypothetical protein M421DRAFT_4300 [Didymella exigua CBS 183.55]
MGRFETLNADTQDLVNCLLPALASAFHVDSVLEIIPEDIRMRAWDCERRDHIKDQTESDPRNWGVQFLKDLKSIARLNGGNLKEFQDRLRAKVDTHEAKHPWCRLNDIKDIKRDYERPDEPEPQSEAESSTSSIDSYLEELHEPEFPKGTKGGRKRNHEIYETRLQLPRKQGRLRRAEDGTLYRKEKHAEKRSRISESAERSTPGRRASRAIQSDEDEIEEFRTGPLRARPRFSVSTTPGALARSDIAEAVSASNEPLEVQKLQAELEVAEAELRAARLKYQYIQAKEATERSMAQRVD